MQALALIDYDNVVPIEDKRPAAEFEHSLYQIKDKVLEYLRLHISQISEVEMRFYGGWRDEQGNLTLKANHLTFYLPAIRGLYNGVRVKPSMAMQLASFPSRELNGTLRVNGKKRGQKMVDTMMTADAFHLADSPYNALLVLSDDDDLLPAAVTVSSRGCFNRAVHVLRKRASGTGLNDDIYLSSGSYLSVHGIIV